MWAFSVIYTSGDEGHTHQFHISTATPWTTFERVASTYLKLRHLGGQLGYRMHRNGSLGELRALKNSTDWEGAMQRIAQAAERNIGGEFVVFNVSIVGCIAGIEANSSVSSMPSPVYLVKLLLSKLTQLTIPLLKNSCDNWISWEIIHLSSTKRGSKACASLECRT